MCIKVIKIPFKSKDNKISSSETITMRNASSRIITGDLNIVNNFLTSNFYDRDIFLTKLSNIKLTAFQTHKKDKKGLTKNLSSS